MLSIAVSNERPESMTAEVVIVPTTPFHICELANTMREKDKQEMENYGVHPSEGLWYSYKNGLGNMTAIIDGEVAAIWGVGGSYLGDVGSPWLLTSSAIHKISPLRFARYYQKEVLKMLDIFERLENYVDSSYEGAVRLLSIVGFTIGESEKIGNGLFSKFSLVKGDR